jgi:hypothetical protein
LTPALEWTIETINSLSQAEYTGKVEINLFQGGVTGVNFSQSIKPLQEVRVLPMGKDIHITLN